MFHHCICENIIDYFLLCSITTEEHEEHTGKKSLVFDYPIDTIAQQWDPLPNNHDHKTWFIIRFIFLFC